MPDAALGDHWLDLAVESARQQVRQVHLEAGRVLNDFGVEQHLVGFAEIEGERVLVHEFAVLLGAFAAHGDGGWRTRGPELGESGEGGSWDCTRIISR